MPRTYCTLIEKILGMPYAWVIINWLWGLIKWFSFHHLNNWALGLAVAVCSHQ